MAKRRIAAAAGVVGLMGALLTGAVPSAAVDEVGSATVVPLQVTGPPEDRLNLIILGDGYTAEEMQQFRDDVDKHLNVQWSIEPFRSYRDYFNVYMIEVVSGVSGISCDPDDGNVRRDTPLKLQYASTCPAEPNARGVTFGPGGQDALEQYVSMIPGEYMVRSNADRARPSPCSPDIDPPNDATSVAASSTNAANAAGRSASGKSMRVCTQPSPKWPNIRPSNPNRSRNCRSRLLL